MSDVKIAQEKGLIDYTPCFASVGHFLQRGDITPILKELIRLSASPLSSVEKDFAVDELGVLGLCSPHPKCLQLKEI